MKALLKALIGFGKTEKAVRRLYSLIGGCTERDVRRTISRTNVLDTRVLFSVINRKHSSGRSVSIFINKAMKIAINHDGTTISDPVPDMSKYYAPELFLEKQRTVAE